MKAGGAPDGNNLGTIHPILAGIPAPLRAAAHCMQARRCIVRSRS